MLRLDVLAIAALSFLIACLSGPLDALYVVQDATLVIVLPEAIFIAGINALVSLVILNSREVRLDPWSSRNRRFERRAAWIVSAGLLSLFCAPRLPEIGRAHV